MTPTPFVCALALALPLSLLADPQTAIDTILAVDQEAQGNSEAAAAWNELSQLEIEQIPMILSSMQGANPLAANYLRSAVETIVARDTEAGKEMPLASLGGVLLDKGQDSRARELAFELIKRADADTAAKLVPGMLNDPSSELRYGSVQRLIDEASTLAEGGNAQSAILVYRQALGAAIEVKQVNTISDALKKLGEEVDLPRHFGFLMHWNVIGPFDNTERTGFDTVYPPEEEIDLNASYQGKVGEVKWQPLVTSDPYGKVDFNEPYGMLKEVVGYAYTEFNSESAQEVEFRLGGKNAWKIWVNGEFLFGRDEYHRGQRIDQYKMKASLQPGKNTILVKCCQNEQKQDWTVQWEFQLRVSDSTGNAILAIDRPPTPKPDADQRRPTQS